MREDWGRGGGGGAGEGFSFIPGSLSSGPAFPSGEVLQPQKIPHGFSNSGINLKLIFRFSFLINQLKSDGEGKW